MPRKPIGDRPMTDAERQARCHVRFQGFRTRNSTRCLFFRLPSQMQACAVEGGH